MPQRKIPRPYRLNYCMSAEEREKLDALRKAYEAHAGKRITLAHLVRMLVEHGGPGMFAGIARRRARRIAQGYTPPTPVRQPIVPSSDDEPNPFDSDF